MHVCFAFRNPEGTVIDLWRYQRDGVEEAITVSGWLMSNRRDVNLDAVPAGEGVARISDLSAQAHLASGQLVPVLLDWEIQDASPVNLLTRRTTRIRVFIDFVTALFRDLEAAREHGVIARPGDRPD